MASLLLPSSLPPLPCSSPIFVLPHAVLILSSLLAHLVSAVLCSLAGYGGMCVLPNFLNDDVPLLESFSPLFGYSLVYLMEQKRKAQERGQDSAAAAAEGAKRFDSAWWCRYGPLNLLIVLTVALATANAMGVFTPAAVPDFIISTQELISMFPSLAPPGWVGDVEQEAAQAASDAAKAKAEEDD